MLPLPELWYSCFLARTCRSTGQNSDNNPKSNCQLRTKDKLIFLIRCTMESQTLQNSPGSPVFDDCQLPLRFSPSDADPLIHLLLRDHTSETLWYVAGATKIPTGYLFFGFQSGPFPRRHYFRYEDGQKQEFERLSPARKWSELRLHARYPKTKVDVQSA